RPTSPPWTHPWPATSAAGDTTSMATTGDGAPAVKVLYVAGSGRSGSTILDRILGQVDGFFSAGELCNLWGRGLLARRRCGCGTPVPDCPVWGAVLAEAFGGADQVDAE